MAEKADSKAPAATGDESSRKSTIKKYDFRQPTLVSHEIMRGLHRIHDFFARSTSRIFSNALNLRVEIAQESEIRQIIFADFLANLKTPNAIYLFEIKELAQWGILQIDPSFCIFYVERQSGGQSLKLEAPRRLTQIEERVMRRIIEKLLKELIQIWSSYINLSIVRLVFEPKPSNVRTISHIQGARVSFKLKIEDQFEVPFNICYPYALLKAEMMNSFAEFNIESEKHPISSGEHQQFEDEMKRVNITAQAVLGEANMSVSRLLNLSEGDLITLDQHIGEPLRIKINEKLKMYGYPGVKNGKKAIKIFDIPKTQKYE
jgi:flagellar motor switch protein FliM